MNINSYGPSSWKIIQKLKNFADQILKFCNSNIYIVKKCIKFSFFILLAYLLFKQLPFNNKTQIFYQNNKINEFIAKNLIPLKYTPTFFMPTCFLQMVYHHYFPRPIIKFKREYIKAPDNGVFSMDWVVDEKIENSKTKSKKLLVIFHGATGGSEAGYIREILRGFMETGEYTIVVVHNRGISDTPLYTPVPFHASFTNDQKFAMEIIKSRHPNLFCFTLGVSMGANIFIKLLANDYSLNNYVRCFVSISNPLNFVEGERRNKGTIMDLHLKNSLKKYYTRHKILRSINDKYKHFRDIDSKFTIKIHKNFKNVEDYYKQSSCYNDLDKLQVPTLFINAKDDLLSPVDTLDLKHFENNDKIMLILTDTGGHVTFYHGNIKPKRWFISKAKNYMESIYKLNTL